MASAKLAKRTVNQSQRATAAVKKRSDDGIRRVRMNSTVVTAAPTSTTNMTGFRSCMRGSSFLKLSTPAVRRMSGSNIDSDRLRRR